MNRMEQHEQDNEQIFQPSARACRSHGFGHQGQHESRWPAIPSISSTICCAPQTLNEWVKKNEVDAARRGGIATEMAETLKALEREDCEIKQADGTFRLCAVGDISGWFQQGAPHHEDHHRSRMLGNPKRRARS
ncbi:MAG: hypothetical protein QNK42_12530 [Pseudodonghicola sp.]|nr:hypothetical protein [Pseudodonghicola sp.]